jgi:ribosome-associated protein
MKMKLFDDRDVRMKSARSGGPGGQNVNKRSTKVQVWLPVEKILVSPEDKERLRKKLASRITQADELEAESDEERSQEANRERALNHLREAIAQALIKPKRRIPTRISKSAEQRFQEAKKKDAEKKKLRKFLPKEWLGE